MITIKGTKIKAKTIPKNKITNIWKTLTTEPLPKISAYQLEDDDFDYIIRLTKCRDDEKRERQEWGKILSAKGTDACVFNADESADVDYIILTRKNPYHSLEDVLEHELTHIAKGDL